MPSNPTTITWKRDFKRHVDNKMKGAYGETDYAKKTIRINKKRHKSASSGRITKNRDGSESLINTIVHEELHASHPKMKEKTVRRTALKLVTRLKPRTKKKIYSLYRV